MVITITHYQTRKLTEVQYILVTKLQTSLGFYHFLFKKILFTVGFYETLPHTQICATTITIRIQNYSTTTKKLHAQLLLIHTLTSTLTPDNLRSILHHYEFAILNMFHNRNHIVNNLWGWFPCNLFLNIYFCYKVCALVRKRQRGKASTPDER